MNLNLVKRTLISLAVFLLLAFMSTVIYLKVKSDRLVKENHLDSNDLASYARPSLVASPLLSPTPVMSPSPSSLASAQAPSVSPRVSSRAVTASPQATAKVYIDVPFLVQAPSANWDSLHEEACEEASLIMVKHYLDKTAFEGNGDPEILKLVNYESQQNYLPDTTIAEVAKIAQSYYQLNSARVETEVTIDKIKQELAAGKPVIIPAAGQELGNPYFTPPGPPYHMLVIKGYDDQGFITNDPGTRQGKDFRYSYSTLYNAIHDWTGDKATIQTGQKSYLVFD